MLAPGPKNAKCGPPICCEIDMSQAGHSGHEALGHTATTVPLSLFDQPCYSSLEPTWGREHHGK